MISLKSLTFQNIGRFVEPQTIDFEKLGSLVQIDAQNLNTGGSSGAGKSTIFKALEFLLGLNDISSGVLQSRLTKDPMSVTGLFDLDGQPLRIERGKKLLIDLNGEVTTGSSKITEEKLDQIIGMPRDLFRKIMHKRQGEGGFFLDLGPAETHRFLTGCLGLEAEQAKILTLDARLAELSDKEISYKSALESNKTGLLATQNAIASLGPQPTLEIDPRAIEELNDRHIKAVEAHAQVKQDINKEIAELEKTRPQIATNPFDRSAIEQIESEIALISSNISKLEKIELDRQSKVGSQIASLQNLVRKLEKDELTRQSDVRSKLNANKNESTNLTQASYVGRRAKEDASKLMEELKKIKASVCPTCEQGWATDAAKAKESDILQKLQEYKKLVIAGIEADKKLSLLEEERKQLDLDHFTKPNPELDSVNQQIADLAITYKPQVVQEAIELKLKADFKNKELLEERTKEREHQSKENSKNKEMQEAFSKKQTTLRESHAQAISVSQKEVDKHSSELNSAKYKIQSFEETKKRFDGSLKKLNDQSDNYRYELQAFAEWLRVTQEEIELATESKKVIKSYLSCSFEDALDSIGDQATKFIRSIPNMSNATVQFEGLKETQQGKVKEEVNCIISMDGEIGIPVKSLSGGERSSTDLAIDLAVIRFIEERTGKGSNLYIMDEPFQFLDSINIEQILEMIRDSSLSKTLIVVDHNPIVKEMIGNKITVFRDGEKSRIVYGEQN